jgi:pimeloyl-ACP methyl ester carboxylesterase
MQHDRILHAIRPVKNPYDALMYPIKKNAISAFIPIRNLQYHVRCWGTPSSTRASTHPPLVLLHGWMDVGASYQFVVDALSESFVSGRQIIAPDWRGFGLTKTGAQDCFWFPDYLADLDLLLDHFAPDQTVDLVGHSMGGNVAMLYAGVRPERVHRLINLEGFGMPATKAEQAAGRYAKWMDELKSLHRGEITLKGYDDAHGVAHRLMKNNPRLSQDKAEWLAPHWAQPNAQGQWEILGDAAHKIVNANLYQVDEVLEIYKRISAPTLSVEASDNQMAQWWQDRYSLAEFHERLKQVPNVSQALVTDAGHMLHHDQPQQVAALIESFVA